MLQPPPRENLLQRLLRAAAAAIAAALGAIRNLFSGSGSGSSGAGIQNLPRTAPSPAARDDVPGGTLTGSASASPSQGSKAEEGLGASRFGPDDASSPAELQAAPQSTAEPEAAPEGPAPPPHPRLKTASATAESTAPEPEPVLLGGSAPRRARPGDVVLAQFAAYVARFQARARQALEREAAPDEVRLGEETDCRWAVGTRVTVRCTARGLNVLTPPQSFVWDGDCRTASFEIEVPEDAEPQRTVIRMEVFVHDRPDAPDAVQVGGLRMTLQVQADAEPGPPERVEAEAARTAFASYASEDRVDVLERVSSIERSAGLKVFLDVIDLRMGDQWETELRRHIAQSDRFLLFWSEFTAGKKWVEWEWKQALAAKGDDALELHVLRAAAIDSIPEPLRRYHFNDVHLLARDAELYRREHAGAPPPPP